MKDVASNGDCSAVQSQRDPGADEVLEGLHRMLASPDFPASERNRRFLAHIVEQSLRGEATKGHDIATKVFGRPSSFDAANDPIVRIEASKLRRDIEIYYLKSGSRDRVRITLPKGRYCALFSYQHQPAERADSRRPSQTFLRAAMLGWSGRSREAAEAWRELQGEHPDFSPEAGNHEALDALGSEDADVRALLLEGIRRAARATGVAARAQWDDVTQTARG